MLGVSVCVSRHIPADPKCGAGQYVLGMYVCVCLSVCVSV